MRLVPLLFEVINFRIWSRNEFDFRFVPLTKLCLCHTIQNKSEFPKKHTPQRHYVYKSSTGSCQVTQEDSI